MDKFKSEIVLTDENSNIKLRKGNLARIITTDPLIVQGIVQFIGDGSVKFSDNIRISYSKIQDIKIINTIEEEKEII